MNEPDVKPYAVRLAECAILEEQIKFKALLLRGRLLACTARAEGEEEAAATIFELCDALERFLR